MSATLDPITVETPDSVSAAELGGFGYEQQLHRRVGRYASFAAGFSFVSILTTVFQLFGLGFGFGGTAFFWTWPAVLVGPVDRRPVLRRTLRPLPAVRRHLPVVPPPRRRGRRVVRGLDDGDRADHHRRRGRDRPAGSASGRLDRLPAHRHRPVAGLTRRRGQRGTARLPAARRHHHSQRGQRPRHRDRELGRRHLRADRRRPARHPAVQPRRARPVRRPAHHEPRPHDRVRRTAADLRA